MLRIIFQNLSCDNGFKNFIEQDVLLNHLLLCMGGEAKVLPLSLRAYLLQHSL
jgi:hypothetical protein